MRLKSSHRKPRNLQRITLDEVCFRFLSFPTQPGEYEKKETLKNYRGRTMFGCGEGFWTVQKNRGERQ